MKYTILSLLLMTSIMVFGQYEADLLGTWSDSTLVASSAHWNTYNEVWGIEVNGHEIAVLGTTFGTHFIDVTDPSSPEELYVIEGGSIGTGIIHRDFHDYKGYLYSIADEGSNTSLQIIDTRNLPDTISVVYDSNQYFTRSHNIFIDSSRARLYSLISNGTAFGYSPMRIFDISDPIDPQPIASYNKFNGYNISQVHDAFVRNDTAYLNLGPAGFALVDFIDVDNPNVISIIEPSDYPMAGYNHSGWPTENGDYYYMADENIESDIKVLDMRDLPDIFIPHTFNAGDTFQIPHNQIVYGDRLYVSYYFDGLQVYDITKPETPERIYYYDTSEEIAAPNLYRGAWGVYPFFSSGNIIVSDMQNGLFVIEGENSVSTEEIEMEPRTITPNPNGGFFTIDLADESFAEGELTLHSINGEIIHKQRVSATKEVVDVKNASNGIYVLKIATSGKTLTQKIIIQR